MSKTVQEIIGTPDYGYLANHYYAIAEEIADDIERSRIILAALFPEDADSARDIAAIPALVWC